MSTINKVVPAVAAALLLAACSGNDKAAQSAPPPVKDTVFGDTVGTTEKARAVEDTVMQQKESIDRTLDQSEQPAAQ
jgi:ABC-type glycerol-3-phosphate transport system substrate-binding protein